MRNTGEYPVTLDEVGAAMEKAMVNISYEKTGEIGSIDPMALKLAYEFLKNNSDFPIWLIVTQSK